MQAKLFKQLSKVGVSAFLLSSSLPYFVLPEIAVAQSAMQISKIDIAGNIRVDNATILSYLGLQEGQILSAGEINAAVQRLNQSGLFEEINVDVAGTVLKIDVVEARTVNRINIEGNDRLDDEDLLSILETKSRRIFSRSVAEADAERIAEAYRVAGRVNTVVTPSIIERDENRVDVVFKVDESITTEIKRIDFVGNRSYSDWRLRHAINSSEAGIFRIFVQSDTYDRQRLDLDLEKLREFYTNRGFVDFNAEAVTGAVADGVDGFYVTFKIEEGQRYRFGDVRVTSSNPNIDLERMRKEIDNGKNEVYSSKRVDTFIERLQVEASRQGVPFIEVRPTVVKDEAERRVDIDFQIVNGPRVFVERIDISGNTQTLDRVIRREFNLVEGDPINPYEIQRAEAKINGTGFFKSVNVKNNPGSAENNVVTAVEVEEAQTGSFQIGGAYASDGGFALNTSIDQKNFLGRGQNVGFSVGWANDNQIAEFRFIEPKLFDRDLRAGVTLSYNKREVDESSYSYERYTFEPEIGFPLTEFSYLTLKYNLRSDDLYDFKDGISKLIVKDEGRLTTSSLKAIYTYDKRNSQVDPTSGFIFSLSEEISGLGGENRYSKSVVNAKAYTSLFGGDVVLSGEVEGGYLQTFGENSRIIDRFQLGGDSFRGFERAGVGPRDLYSEDEDSIGGHSYAVARVEATFPIGLPESYGIYGGVFSDVGTLWSLDDNDAGFETDADGNQVHNLIDEDAHIRASVGASVFWESPFGPLRLNYAVPIKKEDYDKTQRWRLTVGRRF